VLNMAGPVLFSLFAILHLAVSIASFTLVSAVPHAAICFFIVEAVTAFDNAATVVGKNTGIGADTEQLNRLRFLLHATCISLLLPVYSEIGRVFGYGPYGADMADIIAWVLVVVIGLLGYFHQYRGMGRIMPVNYFGCLRYAQSVGDHTRYPGYKYSPEELAAHGKLPIASVLTVLVGLVMAGLIGWLGSFWVPFGVTLIMLAATGFPRHSWGPLATSCLEVVFSGGLLYSLWLAAEITHG
jgi:hypothetical protein